MPNPNNLQVDPAVELTSEEEFDLAAAEEIAATSGKAPAANTAALSDDEKWAQVNSSLEAEAARKGWKPKEQFAGDPKDWVDAQTFVARGERFVKNLQKEVAGLKQKLDSFEGTKAQFIKFQSEVMAAKDKELSDALRQLRVQRSEAQADGDHESVVALEDRIESVTKERTEAKAELAAVTAPAAPTADPVLEAWIGDGNDWFTTDAKLRTYAIQLGDELRAQGETLNGRAFLDKVATLMAAEFPTKFGGNPNRTRAAVAESGRSTAAVAGAKSERDLPAADRALMREFIAAGYVTKEKFLSDYFSRNT
jgi:hypothetical protein